MTTKRNQSGIKKNCQIQINMKNKSHGKIKTKNKRTGPQETVRQNQIV